MMDYSKIYFKKSMIINIKKNLRQKKFGTNID